VGSTPENKTLSQRELISMEGQHGLKVQLWFATYRFNGDADS